MNHPFFATRQLTLDLNSFMRKFTIIFRKILCLCNFYKLIWISIPRALNSKIFTLHSMVPQVYIWSQLSCPPVLFLFPSASSLAFVSVRHHYSLIFPPVPTSHPGLRRFHQCPCSANDVCNWEAASRGSPGICGGGLVPVVSPLYSFAQEGRCNPKYALPSYQFPLF